MIFSSAISTLRVAFEKRTRYSRMVAEIESLSKRDLADLRADRGEMLFQAWSEIYG